MTKNRWPRTPSRSLWRRMETNGATPVTVPTITWLWYSGWKVKMPLALGRIDTDSPTCMSHRSGVSFPPYSGNTNSTKSSMSFS